MRTMSNTVAVSGVVALFALIPAQFEAYPSIYPTGTTIYDPEKAWNGDVVFDRPERQGAVLIDMNGNELRHWKEIAQAPGPTRILPGGFIVGGDRWRAPHQEAVALVQLDWDGKEVWRFDRTEEVILKTEEDETGTQLWSARLHHDWQREGDPVGYYSPEATPRVSHAHPFSQESSHPQISDRVLEDDYLFEVSWDGEIVWEFISPYFGEERQDHNMIYRVYRIPYDWIPQLEKPEERAVTPPSLADFRIEPQ